jgi:hypothetical protein
MEPDGSLPCSQQPATGSYPELYDIHFPLPGLFQRIRPLPWPCVTFRNKLVSYGKELLAPRPTPMVEDSFLSASLFRYIQKTEGEKRYAYWDHTVWVPAPLP